MNSFYKTIDEIKDQYFDGMMLTGAPVEQTPVRTGGLLEGTERDI